MVQHITEPTRYRSGNIPTCDDLLFTNYENSVSNISYNAPLGRSDHVSISCDIHVNLEPVKNNKVYYNYNKANYNSMKKMFEKDWDELLYNKSVQEATDVLENIYNEAVDKYVPKTKRSNNDKKKPIWMNGTAYRSVKRKYSTWTRFLRTKQDATFDEYKIKRNKSCGETRKARKYYEKKIAAECRKNPKSVWRYMKSTNKVSTGIPNLKKQDGSFTKSDEEIAEALNQQYFSQFTNENTSNIPNIPHKQLRVCTPSLLLKKSLKS